MDIYFVVVTLFCNSLSGYSLKLMYFIEAVLMVYLSIIMFYSNICIAKLKTAHGFVFPGSPMSLLFCLLYNEIIKLVTFVRESFYVATLYAGMYSLYRSQAEIIYHNHNVLTLIIGCSCPRCYGMLTVFYCLCCWGLVSRLIENFILKFCLLSLGLISKGLCYFNVLLLSALLNCLTATTFLLQDDIIFYLRKYYNKYLILINKLC